ncbi:MAG TPA: DinB family protein [Parafilimonas sp.]|nr:DinB family protein [Parafilimonas sp.]
MDNTVTGTASEILQQIIRSSFEKFKIISEEDWDYKPLPNKWSKKEILGHLCDSAMNNIRRFVVSQYEENNKIIYQQDNWVASQDYQSENFQNIILLWKLLNEQVIKIINKIPEEKLSNTCITSEKRTIEWLIEDYIVHLNHHLNQIINS